MLTAPSCHIRPRQTREVLRAARHSWRIGRPINWEVVIDFGWIEPGSELRPSRQFRDIRKRFCSWWDYRRKKGSVRGSICDLAIWEAPGGKHHVNWLLSIPVHMVPDAQAAIAKILHKVLGDQPDDTLHQQPIFNLNGKLLYVLKGTEPDYARQLDIRPKDQGAIWFRRAVPSMSLGRAARERDWARGLIVKPERTRGLQLPREKRVIDAVGHAQIRKTSKHEPRRNPASLAKKAS